MYNLCIVSSVKLVWASDMSRFWRFALNFKQRPRFFLNICINSISILAWNASLLSLFKSHLPLKTCLIFGRLWVFSPWHDETAFPRWISSFFFSYRADVLLFLYYIVLFYYHRELFFFYIYVYIIFILFFAAVFCAPVWNSLEGLAAAFVLYIFHGKYFSDVLLGIPERI